MTTIEVTGKTIEEATRLAGEKLGVNADSLSITVIEETKGKGLFGQGKVRLRAEVAAQAAVVEAPAESPKPARAPRVAKKAAAPVAATATPEELAEAPAKEAKVARPRGKKAPEAPAAEAATPAIQEAEVVATDTQAQQLRDLLTGLLAKGELSVDVKVTQMSGRYVTLEIDGTDVAHLIGKHGEVLNAMQYLFNIIASRKYANGVRAALDGNDYRKRREAALTKLALGIAKEVNSRGEEAVLDALPAFERRVVHKALTGMAGVTTYSEGEEPNRRVVIAPAE
ncbi:MAG: KH domain-containing protein [Fimbriimonas ginsengisoli]|nr:KH domain-containing protein [Fimbriimonas ginsengisoli]